MWFRWGHVLVTISSGKHETVNSSIGHSAVLKYCTEQEKSTQIKGWNQLTLGRISTVLYDIMNMLIGIPQEFFLFRFNSPVLFLLSLKSDDWIDRSSLPAEPQKEQLVVAVMLRWYLIICNHVSLIEPKTQTKEHISRLVPRLQICFCKERAQKVSCAPSRLKRQLSHKRSYWQRYKYPGCSNPINLRHDFAVNDLRFSNKSMTSSEEVPRPSPYFYTQRPIHRVSTTNRQRSNSVWIDYTPLNSPAAWQTRYE